jgi:hypothetical protein
MTAIASYLRTDFRESDGVYRSRVAPKERSSHHFDAVTDLIKGLPEKGWKTKEIEKGLHYVLISCEAPEASIREAFAQFINERLKFFLNVNEFKKVAFGYYPFPLCIRDAEALFQFYSGQFLIYVVLDIGYINDCLAAHDVKVESLEGAWSLLSLVPNDMWGERLVTSRAVGQFAGEFLSLDWFIANILTGEMQE